jgi:hypothetical protein
MGMSSVSVRTTNLTITQAGIEVRTTGAVRAKILELQIIQSLGTAQSIGFGRPQALGVTPGGEDDLAEATIVVAGGKITDKGLAELRDKMPFADPAELDKFAADPKLDNMGDLFTVNLIVRYLKAKLGA